MTNVASIADTPGPWRSYKEKVARIAQHIVDAQQPIRVLDHIKWSPEVFERFRDSRWREPPQVGPDFYQGTYLGFEPETKKREFREIAKTVDRELGDKDAIGSILADSAREYGLVVELLESRGTPRFYELSRRLYGSSRDRFADGVTEVRHVAHDLYDTLTNLDDSLLGPQLARDIEAAEVVQILNQALGEVFGDGVIRVILDDGIVADAAAGSDYIKIRQGARFNRRDVRILEVHEGWAHVATSLNGQQQPVARWLAKGPPRVAATQEGLAAVLEILTLVCYPSRARRLNDRVLAVEKAEAGANFLEVFEWFRTEGYDEEVCFWNTQRVFRGGMVEGGAPFTKDIVYMKGIVTNFSFLQSAIAIGRPELIRWMFVGKVAIEDIPVLAQRAHEGIVRPPKFVPKLFEDLNGLAMWLALSTFWGRLNNRAIVRHYEKMFEEG
ncbi:MAG TPA: flavohemoglobin expression-modulating QEGLA motif protein [Polyangiaceae bacterium]